MRILITGSRDWTDVQTIRTALYDILEGIKVDNLVIVSGACPTGADKIAEDIAHEQGWTVDRHPADWQKLGKAAGFVRNNGMVSMGADVCLAFIKDESKGATHCSNAAQKANIATRVYRI